MCEATYHFGTPIAYPKDMESILEGVGFMNMSHKTIRIQLKPPSTTPHESTEGWIERICKGMMFQTKENPFRADALEALSMYLFTDRLHWKEEEVRRICLDAAHVCHSRRLPTYFNL